MAIQLQFIDFLKDSGPSAEAHADGAEPLPSEGTPKAGFASDVSRAVHSGLIMRPIFELEARRFLLNEGDEQTPLVWQGVDVCWLALSILDTISELSEYQVGATRSEVLEKILPLARQQAQACDMTVADDGLLDVLNKVFDHLANREKRYLPFRYTFFDGTSGRYQTRRFWLIKTVYTGEGGEARFTLTDEGYAAYFGLHETSALDATAIGNLRIKLLIERGNVDDAISVAEGNRKQCARKALEIRNARHQIRRNIHAVDFEALRALADEGVNQATDIQKEGSRLYNMVIENLLSASGQAQGAKLQRLAERLERLNHQLMRLSTELQRLPEDYHSHSHKLFRRRDAGAFPAMEEVMERVFRMAETDAARIGTEFIARIDPPAQRPLFDPAAVIEACDRALERQNVPGDRNQAVLEVDGTAVARFATELTEPLMHQAFAMLHATVRREGEVRLSGLLSDAVASGNGALFPVAVAMAVFQCLVERRLADKFRIRVEMMDPEERIAVDLPAGRRYRGHELALKPRFPRKEPPRSWR
jgi:hypothetical protein